MWLPLVRALPWLTLAILAALGCGGSSGGAGTDAAIADRHDAAVVADSAADAGDAQALPDGAADRGFGDATAQQDAAPQGCIQGAFSPYFGNLHAHTGYSDGTGTPAEAFDHARFVAGLDILVLTDHGEQIGLHGGWAQYASEADAKNVPGVFLAMTGFEYGSGFILVPPSSTGHNNVFFTDGVFGATDLDFRDFYRHLVECGTCIGQFNHPGDGTTTSWNSFEYHADADERLNLIEFNSPVAWDQFFLALSKGWTVSPMWNQDNHSANWGTANDNRSGLWMASLDRQAMREAMLARRTFATQDKKAWIKTMAAGTCWMGSILRGISSVPITVEVADTDNDVGFATIELFGPDKAQLFSHDCGGSMTCTASYTAVAPPSGTRIYVVARATMVNGRILVSAPVWASAQ